MGVDLHHDGSLHVVPVAIDGHNAICGVIEVASSNTSITQANTDGMLLSQFADQITFVIYHFMAVKKHLEEKTNLEMRVKGTKSPVELHGINGTRGRTNPHLKTFSNVLRIYC